MNPRTWRAAAVGVSIAVVLLLATQRAAGQRAGADEPASRAPVAGIEKTTGLPAIPESASLLLLGSAFVVAAQQLRRLI